LLQRYLPALRAHLRLRRHVSDQHLDDLLQGFISAKILERDLVERADPHKGRFRTLLLTALERYVVSQQRSRLAIKRGNFQTVALNESAAIPSTGTSLSAADSFDLVWARQLLSQAMDRVRRDCESSQRMNLWDIFECAVVGPTLHGTAPARYEQLVDRFGFKSPSQMWNAVRTSKQMFIRALRAVAGEYAQDEAAIDAEIQDLHRILSVQRAG
jgi:RNA polymerase sigma-70 factor (ECF subfamily)